MKVFLCWSGDASKAVASALRGWLPLLNNSFEPWMSEIDIPRGTFIFGGPSWARA